MRFFCILSHKMYCSFYNYKSHPHLGPEGVVNRLPKSVNRYTQTHSILLCTCTYQDVDLPRLGSRLSQICSTEELVFYAIKFLAQCSSKLIFSLNLALYENTPDFSTVMYAAQCRTNEVVRFPAVPCMPSASALVSDFLGKPCRAPFPWAVPGSMYM